MKCSGRILGFSVKIPDTCLSPGSLRSPSDAGAPKDPGQRAGELRSRLSLVSAVARLRR